MLKIETVETHGRASLKTQERTACVPIFYLLINH